MDKLREAIILAGQAVGRTKQDHIVFKCNKGYDFGNPKMCNEPTVRIVKYNKDYISVHDENGKELKELRAIPRIILLKKEAKNLKIKFKEDVEINELSKMVMKAKKIVDNENESSDS